MKSIGAPQSFEREADGFFHPDSEDELAALVRYARREGRQLRVRGSGHSVGAAIYTDDAGARERRHVDVMLDRYVGVVFDIAQQRVTVDAGCHLGLDPRDPTRTSTWDNSLTAQLDARGWALPDLGGVTHQTISGFLMTGSCGGSVQHGCESCVVALRMIDGTGEIHELHRDRDPLFDAALCSMGLLGVISKVTLQCQARFDIIGREDITTEAGCAYELFGDGDGGLEGFLRTAEYARLMWWPQEGVRRVVSWQARRMQTADYTEATGARGALTPKRYSALGDLGLGARATWVANQASQAMGGLFYDAIAQSKRAASMLPARSTLGVRANVARLFSQRLLPAVLQQFVPVSGPQRFWDSWHLGLPLDNQMSEASLPTDFTEIWVPLSRTGEVMRALRGLYDRGGFATTGAFICEVYAARASRSWMHPGYGRDSLRIDLFWFRRNPGDPTREWFPQFWQLLRDYDYRLHWGKYLPRDVTLGARHLRRTTPRWDDFMAERARLDPDGVFLTRYWRSALDLGGI